MRAARERGLVRRVAVWDILPEHARRCVAEGWADEVFETPERAAREGDLTVVATPADTVADLVARIASHLKPGGLVTDAGSTKAGVVRAAHATPGAARWFVGAHPMAGSEKNGPAASRADLFEGRVCFVTPAEGESDPVATARVCGFWSALGARVVTRSPEEHDAITAHVSHLPHAMAVALVLTLADRPESWRVLGGGGLRDTSRVAGGDPEIWRAIFSENRREVVRALDEAREKLALLRGALDRGDDATLIALLTAARDWRAGLAPER